MRKRLLVATCLLAAAAFMSMPEQTEPKEQSIQTPQPVVVPKVLQQHDTTPKIEPKPLTKPVAPVRQEKVLASRSAEVERPKAIKMEVTGYTAGYESTGKTPDHPEYEITASGKRAKRGVTVAAGKSIPFGTKVYIPDLKWFNGTGVFTVQDRGGAIDNTDIDVYFGTTKKQLQEALDFGRNKNMDVYILEEE